MNKVTRVLIDGKIAQFVQIAIHPLIKNDMKKNTKGKWHEDMKNQPMQYIKLSQENTQKSGNPKQLMNSGEQCR